MASVKAKLLPNVYILPLWAISELCTWMNRVLFFAACYLDSIYDFISLTIFRGKGW